jgi:hypothetical protein
MGSHTHEQSDDRPEVDRRSMLRRGGVVVAATVAGVTAVEALNAGNAQAAPGDALVLGSQVLNDSGAESTSLTSNAPGATITVENSGDRAPLGLATQSGASFLPTVSGELANLDGFLYCTENIGTSGPFTTFVYTEITATQVVPITPNRVLDTRTTAGRTHIVNRTGNLDSAGRLLGGHTINIDLSGLEVAALTAFCNLTVVGSLAGGYLTLFPEPPKPPTSSINFTKGAVVANFAVTGTSVTDTVSIFASATTHVILDITAFGVGSPAQIFAPIGATAAAVTSQRLAARAKAGTLPKWYRGGLSR